MIQKTEAEIMKNWEIKDIENPLVSIFCLAFNHQEYVTKTLDGFLMQETAFPFEIIIHDDCSTDKTALIIQEYVKKYPNIIHPIYETENQYSKCPEILNEIMYRTAKGKYIALCEGDDYWCDSSKIQMQADILESHTECSIAFCKVQCIDKNGKSLSETIPFKDSIKEGVVTLKDYTREEFSNAKWAFHTSSFFYRSELGPGHLKIMKKDFKDFPYGDMPLLLYCLLNGNGFYINKIQSCYRTNSGGYNSFIQKNTDTAILHEKKLIRALCSLDNLTNKCYHEDILARIRRGQFKIDFLQKNIKGILNSKYKKYISPRKRLINLICITFPRTYNCYKKIRIFIKLQTKHG